MTGTGANQTLANVTTNATANTTMPAKQNSTKTTPPTAKPKPANTTTKSTNTTAKVTPSAMSKPLKATEALK